jgi:hypothetical protein
MPHGQRIRRRRTIGGVRPVRVSRDAAGCEYRIASRTSGAGLVCAGHIVCSDRRLDWRNDRLHATPPNAEPSREQARPYVAVYLAPTRDEFVIFDLVVKNFGATAASNIKVRITPKPVRAIDRSDPNMVGLIVPDVIPTLTRIVQ